MWATTLSFSSSGSCRTLPALFMVRLMVKFCGQIDSQIPPATHRSEDQVLDEPAVHARRELIDHTTSMITDGDPLRGLLFYSHLGFSHTLHFSKKGDGGAIFMVKLIVKFLCHRSCVRTSSWTSPPCALHPAYSRADGPYPAYSRAAGPYPE